MKKHLLKISSLLLSALLGIALVGCDPGTGDRGKEPDGGSVTDGGTQNGERLSAPTVTVDKDGFATWEAVENAMYYVYVIDGGEEQINAGDGVQLTDGQTIKVKAVSADSNRADSDFSTPQAYHKGDYVELSIYAVNDLHGKFMDTSTQPGLDEFTTYYKNLVKDPAREEILLSSGDMWQGTAESLLNKGKLMTEWMNDVGFVSMTLGNHEFDWGSAVLTPNSELAEFPFLAINVRENGVRPDYCSASTVVERGDMKIGIIGAIGDCLSSISSEYRGGLKFDTGSSLTTLVKNEATRLRTEENCDFIVYSIHDGGEDSSSGTTSVTNADMGWYDSSLSNGYVDLVFEGHTHKKYTLRDEYGVYHLQGSSENRDLSCADISFNTATGEFTVTPRHLSQSVYAPSSLEDDPIVDELYGKYFPERDLYLPVGTTAYDRNSSAILSKVAELYYLKGLEAWSGYNIVCGGGFLNARNPYNIYKGDVSYADIATVLPFDNEIVLGRISGSDLIRFLNRREASSNRYTIYTTIETDEVNTGGTYYIVVDSYTSSYTSNRITEVARLGSGIYARDLLKDFIQGGGWA